MDIFTPAKCAAASSPMVIIQEPEILAAFQLINPQSAIVTVFFSLMASSEINCSITFQQNSFSFHAAPKKLFVFFLALLSDAHLLMNIFRCYLHNCRRRKTIFIEFIIQLCSGGCFFGAPQRYENKAWEETHSNFTMTVPLIRVFTSSSSSRLVSRRKKNHKNWNYFCAWFTAQPTWLIKREDFWRFS